jgi:hypothetical protein
MKAQKRPAANTDNMGKLFPAFSRKKREHNLSILPGRYAQIFA